MFKQQLRIVGEVRVIPAPFHRLAVAIARLSAAALPADLRHWGQAMQYEVKNIERTDRAILFAFGCLGFALRQALISHILSPLQASLLPIAGGPTSKGGMHMNLRNELYERPRRMTAICAITATGLGLAYMGAAGAPLRYLAMNISALMLGFVSVGIVALCARHPRLTIGVTSLALGSTLLLTSLFGATVDGASRWIAVGGLFVQSSLLFLPVMAICFVRAQDRLSTIGIVVASLALAIQPDRAMSGALAAGIAVLALMRPNSKVIMALVASVGGFLVTLLRADTLPAAPYVDQILYSSFDVHPLAGIAVLSGAALMIVPAVVGYHCDDDHREVYAVFGAIWLTIIIAAALGNYPTPVVGYGGSAIVGYVVSLLGLPKRASAYALDRHSAGPRTNNDEYQHDLCVGLSCSI